MLEALLEVGAPGRLERGAERGGSMTSDPEDDYYEFLGNFNWRGMVVVESECWDAQMTR
jgi:hypothetical protein